MTNFEKLDKIELAGTSYINGLKEVRDSLGRSEGARLLAIAITDAEHSLAMVLYAESQKVIPEYSE